MNHPAVSDAELGYDNDDDDDDDDELVVKFSLTDRLAVY